jgi:hypothetical protein
MEMNKQEVAQVIEVVAEAHSSGFSELSAIHLALVGGGVGEVVLA